MYRCRWAAGSARPTRKTCGTTKGVAAVILTFDRFQLGHMVVCQRVRQPPGVIVPTRMQSDHPRFASRVNCQLGWGWQGSAFAALKVKLSAYHDSVSSPISANAGDGIAHSHLLITCCSRDAAGASTCGHASNSSTIVLQWIGGVGHMISTCTVYINVKSTQLELRCPIYDG